MRPALALPVVVAALTLGAVSAWAGSPTSVKSGGLWYWSLDVTEQVFPPETSTPFASVGLRKITQDLDLPLDQKRWLQAQLAGHVQTGTWPPTFKNGVVVHSMTCRGIGTSIPSDEIDVDLYHRFRCIIKGATYKRQAKFQAGTDVLADRVKASPKPVPQTLLDKLVAAYRALDVYQNSGDPTTRTVTLVVTGRRDVTIVGLGPLASE
jgi:hypothetical protein